MFDTSQKSGKNIRVESTFNDSSNGLYTDSTSKQKSSTLTSTIQGID